MDQQKKLDFVHKQTKLALEHVQHMDAGGAIIPSTPAAPAVGGPTTVGGGGNTGAGGLNGALGLSNQFQATGAPIQQGTNAGQLNTAYTGATQAIDAAGNLVNQTAPVVQQGIATEGTLGTQLAGEAAGTGPNPAQEALATSTGNNVATTAALEAGARGSNGNVGLLTRNIGQQGAATQQGAAGQAATLQAQEEIAAQQQEAGLAATEVGQGTGAVTGLNSVEQGEQGILQGANTAGNNAVVSSTSNVNNVNGQVATGNQNASQNTAGGILSGVSSGLGLLFAKGGMVKMDKGGNVLDAASRAKIAPHDFALPGGRYPIHDISHARNALARVAQNGTPAEKTKVKAAVHKKYPSLAGKKMASGGEVPSTPTEACAPMAMGGGVKDGWLASRRMASGGYMAPTPLVVSPGGSPASSSVGQFLNSNYQPGSGPQVQATPQMNSTGPTDLSKSGAGLANAIGDATEGGEEAPTGPTDAETLNNYYAAYYGAPSAVDSSGNLTGKGTYDLYKGLPDAEAYGGKLAAKGGDVKAGNPSQKATVKGDSLKNDKIPTLLSQGEVVMDRDTLADPGPVGQMARAVAKHIEKRNKGKK